MKLEVLGAVAIPVGHRVSVRWYHKKSKGLFGGDHDESRPSQPILEDLETGIVYAFDWLYDGTAAAVPSGANPADAWPTHFSDGLRLGVEEQRVVVGRVSACRIVTTIQRGSMTGTCLTQTDLTIVEDKETGAYR
jgi:hypothetical protein